MMQSSEIWDCHVHLFPPEIYRNFEKYASKDTWFRTLMTKRPDGKGTEEFWADSEEALACADAAGVYGLVMQGWYWNDLGLQRMHNDYMAELIAKYPDRLRAFVSVNPKFGAASLQEVERCVRLGFSGIGELGPGGNGYDFQDHQLIELVECAQAYHLPVCIHCGEPVGHRYPGRDTTSLAPLPDLARSYPDVAFILAHLGGGLPFYELNRRIHKSMATNVYYDSAANPLLYDTRSLRIVTDLVGPERLLFGSDFPLNLYPSKNKQMDMTRFVQEIQHDAGLTEKELTLVMGENLRDLLHIE